MSWSSSIVSPPDGDMLAYYRSLERLLDREDDLYLGGHGPVLPEPRSLVRELLSHRQHREGTILARWREQAWAVAELSAALYAKTDPLLKIAAQRNVLAHLLKLKAEGRVEELSPDTELHPDAQRVILPPGEVSAESGGALTAMQQDSMRRFGLVGVTPEGPTASLKTPAGKGRHRVGE